MEDALNAKNKMGFVDGTISRSKNDSSNLENWVHCDVMVKSWLKNSMSKELLESARYAKSAKDIWFDLEEYYLKGNASRIYQIRWAISLLQQEKAQVAAYYSELKGLWDEL